jgi:D-alanyl-lipoteichoic acid acyltransferase DltB (MBOAT superfamily)
VSGPIERAEHFKSDRELQLVRVLDDQRALGALSRIVLGYFKLAVVSAVAQYAFTAVSTPLLAEHGGLTKLQFMLDDGLSISAYTIYLYTNFSGYMDIVIGIGWMLGQNLPENFDHPFAARNLFEFWSRWHMTLSEWFKTYLFNPLVKAFAERVSNPRLLPSLGVLAFFVSFFVMGVWHGSTIVFVIYGLVMGAGVSLNKLWQMALTRRLGKKHYRALAESALYTALAQGLTFGFFAMAVTALWVDVDQLGRIAHGLGSGGALIVLIAVSLCATLVFTLARVIGHLLPSRQRVAAWRASMPVRHAALAMQVLVIFIIASFFHKAPEFVYKAF